MIASRTALALLRRRRGLLHSAWVFSYAWDMLMQIAAKFLLILERVGEAKMFCMGFFYSRHKIFPNHFRNFVFMPKQIPVPFSNGLLHGLENAVAHRLMTILLIEMVAKRLDATNVTSEVLPHQFVVEEGGGHPTTFMTVVNTILIPQIAHL